jgi:hypothetical protein
MTSNYNKLEKDTDDIKLLKRIKKSISQGVKHLRDYRMRILKEEEKKQVYDGGASILLSYIQGKYAIDLGFEKNCDNLVKCAQDYIITHPKPLLNYNKSENDLFDTNFLREIFLQKSNQYPLRIYIQKMETYLQNGNGFINQILPILDIFSQRQVRYVNVGLGLFGLMEQNYEKTTANKEFRHLKKRVARELADIFHNKSNYDPLYLDTVKAYSLFLLHLLEEEDRIDEDDYKKFSVCLMRTQNSIGNWIHSNNYDSVNEINNTILTIFAVINLLNYYKKLSDSMTEIENQTNVIEGFQGGFLTQKNMDIILSTKICFSTFIEAIILLFMIIIFLFLLVKIYRQKNI